MQKKYFLKVLLIFFMKKADFWLFFFFSWPAFGHGRLGHPQSLEYYVKTVTMNNINYCMFMFTFYLTFTKWLDSRPYRIPNIADRISYLVGRLENEKLKKLRQECRARVSYFCDRNYFV